MFETIFFIQARSAKEAGKDGRHEQVLRMLENADQFRANPMRGDGSSASPSSASSPNRTGTFPNHGSDHVTAVEPRDPLIARQYAQRLLPILARVTQVPLLFSRRVADVPCDFPIIIMRRRGCLSGYGKALSI